MSAPDDSVSTEPEERRQALHDLLFRLVSDARLETALIGGQAVNHWTRPRFTTDFDLAVAANEPAVRHIVAALINVGFQILRDQRDPVVGTDFVRMERPERYDIVDLQVAHTDFQRSVISRAVREDPSALPIATPEDLVVLKLLAHRSKDYRDIEALAEARQLNWDYIEHWARIWDVMDELTAVRERVASAGWEQPSSQ